MKKEMKLILSNGFVLLCLGYVVYLTLAGKSVLTRLEGVMLLFAGASIAFTFSAITGAVGGRQKEESGNPVTTQKTKAIIMLIVVISLLAVLTYRILR